jgi:hypothetical protein
VNSWILNDLTLGLYFMTLYNIMYLFSYVCNTIKQDHPILTAGTLYSTNLTVFWINLYFLIPSLTWAEVHVSHIYKTEAVLKHPFVIADVSILFHTMLSGRSLF